MAFRILTGPGRLAAILLAGAAMMALLPPSPARAGMEEGRAALRTGDLATAFQQFRAAAEGGNAEAQYLTGQMLSTGQGADRDVRAALDWLERASAAGHIGAQMMAGTIYASGDGIPADYERALKHLRPAANAGDALAQNNLAVLIFYGLGTRADPVEALAWALRAERQRLVQAIDFRQEVEKSITPEQKRAALKLAAEPLEGAAARAPGTQRLAEAPAAPPAEPAVAAPAPQAVAAPTAAPPAANRPTAPSAPRVPSTVQAQELAPMQPAPEPAAPPAAEVASLPPPAPAPAPAPAPEPAAPAPAAPGSGAWSVQVAALPSAAEADRQWAAIARRQSSLLDGQPMDIATIDLGEKGVFHRILVGRFGDADSARTFCARLKEAGQDCLVRKR